MLHIGTIRVILISYLYNKQDIMTELNQYFQRHTTLLQGYVFAQDPKAYVQALTTPQDQKFFSLILSPYSAEDQQTAKQLGLQSQARQQLQNSKLLRQIRGATTHEQKQVLIKKILKQYQYLAFQFQQPAQIASNLKAQENKELENQPNNVLETQETVEAVVLKAVQENPNNFMKLSPYGLNNFPLSKLKTMEERHFGFLLEKKEILRSLDAEAFTDILSQFIIKAAKSKKSTEEEQFPREFYETLTLQQLELLKKKLPKLFSGYSYYQQSFSLKYQEKLRQFKRIPALKFVELQDKKKLCIEILAELQEQKSEFSFFYVQKLTQELLLIQQSLIDSDTDRFIKYVKNLRTVQYENLNQEFRQNIKDVFGKNKYLNKNHQPLHYLDSAQISQSELINRTIIALFKKNQAGTIEKLAPYISRKYLEKEQAKIKLSLGFQSQISNIYDLFTVSELNEIKERKMLRFSPRNPKVYKVNDKVELGLTAKNVKSIIVKIYTIDLEKLYLENNQINEHINLKFLVPIHQPQTIEIKAQDPFFQQLLNIQLKQLEKELGLFIVDLQGDGLSSRAIIRKGTIIVKNKIVAAGHQLTFYDQNGQKISNIALWRDGKKIEVNGSYIIPFGPQGLQQIIPVYQKYAQKQTVTIIQENYSLSVDYVFHSESFIVGQKSKIILRPELRLASQRISIERLKKVILKVTTINNQGISYSTTQQNVTLKDSEDFILEVPVKSYLRSLTISIEAQVSKIDKTTQKLNSNKTVSIDLEEENNNFIDIYLARNTSAEYILAVKGKNGEPIPNVGATFSYEQFGINFSFSKSLTANQQGIFKLGKLWQVRSLTTTINSNGFSSVRTWKLNQFSQSISYGGPIFNNSYKIYVQQGESIVLPIPCQLKERDLVFYHQNIMMNTTKNCIKQLLIENNRLTGKNLAVGRYTLIFLKFDRRIDIEVVKGRKWINDDIIDNNTIYKVNKKINNLVTLGEIKANVVENHIQYDIELITNGESLPSDLRVHLFAKNYIDSENNEFFTCSNANKCIPNNIEYLNIKQSQYYNDKALSDETSYVLNRRNQQITSGNNLQKPHIFLKRIEVRGTDSKDEELRNQGAYIQPQAYLRGSPMKCAMRSMDMLDMKGQRMYDQYALKAGGYGSTITLQRKINSHNNFLGQAGHLSANIKEIKGIKVPLGYSQLIVQVFTNETAIKRDYSLPQANPVAINLAHSKIADKGDKEGWTMSRQIYKVPKGQKIEISRNSTWTTVSKANVVEYASAIGITLPQWLSFWHLYDQKKKIQTYDKQFSHQLNFFLYKNDRAFFDKVVKPFLANRIRKTFVDLYLLESNQALVYAAPHRLQKLNYFERALLVQTLKNKQKLLEAKILAESMQLPLKNIKQQNQVFKVFFETILNAKKTGQIPPPPPPSAAIPFMAPPPPTRYAAQTNQIYEDQCNYQSYNDECLRLSHDLDQKENMHIQNQMFQKAQQQFKAGFKQTQKTREYTDTTYAGVTDTSSFPTLIQPSLFWAELAKHNSTKTGEDFLSDKFSALRNRRDFILACSVLSSISQAAFQLVNKGGNYVVSAKSSFLVFVREVKALPFKQTGNVVLNQRFFDPKNKFYYDQEGNKCQKSVAGFLVLRPYALQTIITNISGSNLQVQLLIDIPEGAIPLKNHEQTQISNISINSYSTVTLERQFYFPSEGKYSIYPANASRSSTIIAKAAPSPLFSVTIKEVSSQKQTLDNILRSGTDDEVYNYLKTKNIFDQNIFNFKLILWKLKNKEFFQNCLAIFKGRNYFNPIVWSFGIYHENFDTAIEFLENRNQQGLGVGELNLPIFQYYPYYSNRVHKFADEKKSTIRVKEFKDNYAQFLATVSFEGKVKDPITKLTLIYYLILQDRTSEVRSLRNRISAEESGVYQLQYDYIDCFLDMSDGAHNDYAIARKISANYINYLVPAWRKLFLDVYEALSKENNEEAEEVIKSEEATFSTIVVNHGTEIKINRPAQTKVLVNFYKIDLQLYFSEFPFSEIGNFSAVSPSKCLQFNGSAFQVHTLLKKDYEQLGDSVVEFYEYKQISAPKQISRFLWTNPAVKVKINEKQGTLKVFYDKKKCSTSYCKVYSRGSKGDKFYRDGYTDIASTFRYALDIKDVTEFSILVMTNYGGSIHKVRPPSVQ